MFSWKIRKSFYSSLSPATIWSTWTDLNSWPLFDDEVRKAELSGPFKEGTEGLLILKNGQKISFTLEHIEEERVFTDSSPLPLTSLKFEHRIMPNSPTGCTLIQTVTCKGLLAPILRFTLHRQLQRDMLNTLKQLDQLAQNPSHVK
ncbi:Uncharacterized protein AB751O23_AA_00430 [Chlamydiales bacterium SCGC AB-751-O23]|nr:Uncharacterized protein AB751O23_AA_00430 [Chlamydiales bacterium SCGC AB-751-O23]